MVCVTGLRMLSMKSGLNSFETEHNLLRIGPFGNRSGEATYVRKEPILIGKMRKGCRRRWYMGEVLA
jgi:hypothetical protein